MENALSSSDPARRPTVLVVDDSATMRASVSMSLSLGGYEVVTAEDGGRAIALLQAGLKPDLILTDIMMPNVDGMALIREARQRLRFTPIVALTTQSHQKLKDEARQLGLTAWMLKPTGGEDLLRQVHRFLNNASPKAPRTPTKPAL
jgi:two-component system chemotaxis response regulator CheY